MEWRCHFLVPLLLAVTVAAACAPGAGLAPQPPPGAQPAPPTPQPPGAQTAPPAPQPPPGAQPAPAAPEQPAQPAPAQAPPVHLQDVVTPAPAGALARLRFAPGAPIGRAGIFFLQVASGAVEGWAVAGAPELSFHYMTFADHRWVMATGNGQTYLADRTTGALYQWEPPRATLLAAGGEYLLFASPGRLWLATGNPLAFRELSLAPAQAGAQPAAQPTAQPAAQPTAQPSVQPPAQAEAQPAARPTAQAPAQPPAPPRVLFAPDGQALLLVSDRRLYLVQTATGAARAIGVLPAPEPGSDLDGIRLEPARRGAEVVVAAESGRYGPPGQRSVHVRRYSWQGELLAQGTAPGWGGLSPDGHLAYWVEDLGAATSAVTLASAADLTPRFRLKGATACAAPAAADGCWLADGSGLVVRVRGGYRILRPDGTLAGVPALEAAQWQAPIPAPDRPDVFAIGCTTVVGAGGGPLAAAVPYAQGGPHIGTGCGYPWGSSGEEVMFILGTGGKGSIYMPPQPLDPVAERPPFPATVTLRVMVPAGDCLNLRLGYGQEAPVLRCLAPGARLAPATPPGRLNKGWIERFGDLQTTDWGGTWWLHVRTEQGERGWVAFLADHLAWAPAPDAGFPADPLTALVEDEVANLQHWLQVALGEKPCGQWCGSVSLEEVVLGLLNQCNAGGPDRLRQAPGYDPARHGPALDRARQACTVLQTAFATVGHPGETPAWRQQVRDALAAVSP